MLRKLQLTFCLMLFAVSSVFAYVVNPVDNATKLPEFAQSLVGDQELSAESFLELTPKKVREITGQKLSLKEVVGLKIAQKQIKKQMRRSKKGKDEQFPKGLFIICAIFVPLAACIFMGVMDDWEGNTWWVAFLLYVLCYFPGLIYTLTKMKNYYP